MNDIRSDGGQDRREQLSALMDGELDADAAAGCCELWREQSEARANWHLYHVIGDVLRADSRQVTCCDGARSARLLQAVRERIAAEPPVRLSGMPRSRLPRGGEGGRRRPSPPAAPPRWRTGWLGGAAVAAFAAVAGVIVVIEDAPAPALPGSGTTLAGAAQQATSVAVTLQQPSAQDAQLAAAAPLPTEPADMQLIRDARLDQYLAAHTQFGGSSALGVPSGFLRSSTLQVPGR